MKTQPTPKIVKAGDVRLQADIAVPPSALGLVLFAHGSGSSRQSPRNRFVAEAMNQGGLGTILMDLLTLEEEAIDERTAEFRFNIPLLANRLILVTDWVEHQRRLARLPLGCFGASTGAAAALIAAARRSGIVRAVVSRGGRPDLAGSELSTVTAPCLFLVGGNDPEVIDLNRSAMAELPPETMSRLEVIPGATHLFEEPGALEQVAEHARSWFLQHLAGGAP